MKIAEMSKLIAAAQVGDTIVVTYSGGQPTPYKVERVNGHKARELYLVGRRGGRRVLVDGAETIWLREGLAGRKARWKNGAVTGSRKTAHRRVTALELQAVVACSAAAGGDVLADLGFRQGGDVPRATVDVHAIKLPRDYRVVDAIEPVGYFIAVCDIGGRTGFNPPPRPNPFEAANDAWEHDAGMLRKMISMMANSVARALGNSVCHDADGADWLAAGNVLDAASVIEGELKTIESTRTELRQCIASKGKIRDDLERCRKALRQCHEIARGDEPTGKELAQDVAPESVAAAVGHALRIESKRTFRSVVVDKVNLDVRGVEPTADGVFAAFLPRFLASEAKRSQPYSEPQSEPADRRQAG